MDSTGFSTGSPRHAPAGGNGSPNELHLARVLADHLRRRHTYVALARAISAANQLPAGEKDAIDRRKLKKIVEGDRDLVLSVAELRALDRYLEPFGEGLAYNPFFRRANVLQAIADAGRPVTFLLGSKSTEDSRLYMDHWDVRALAEVQRGVGNFASSVRFDIRDVLLHDDLDDAFTSVTSGAWTELLQDDGPSLVCLGSGRATHATELLFSRMFDIPVFQDVGHKVDLPFHFVWNPDLHHVFRSSFRYTTEELEILDPRAAGAVRKGLASALEIGGHVYLDRLGNRRAGESYGVCVAQRRPGGQIWLVSAGVTGPATYAATRLLDRLALQLQAGRTGRPSPVYWAAVRATIASDPRRQSGNFPIVESQEILIGPDEWPGSFTKN